MWLGVALLTANSRLEVSQAAVKWSHDAHRKKRDEQSSMGVQECVRLARLAE